MESLTQILSEYLPTIAILGTVLAASVLWPSIRRSRNFGKFPLLDTKFGGRPELFMAHAAEVYDEGYQKFPHDFHRIATPEGEHLIIPNRYLDELKNRSDEEIDVLAPFKKAFENDYVKVFPSDFKTRIVNSVVKKELTRSLPKINPRLSKCVQQTVAAELPPCHDWTEVNVNQVVLRMIAIVSGFVFFGPELCHREEYLQAAVNYTMDAVMAVPVMKKWPRWLKPYGAWIEPQLEKVREHRRRMRAFLAPIMEQRNAAKKRGEEMPEDTLHWMLERAEENGVTDPSDLANMQLLLTTAAINTTGAATTIVIYELASRPDVIKACRAEIRAIMKSSDGELTSNDLFNMKLLDSVMRESMRVNPPFLDGFRRGTLKDITLKDGTEIPAGYTIEAANKAILMDPNLYPNPETFDPYRFYKLRTTEEPDPIGFQNREQYQFVSSTKENMAFGFGRHACPGRFFAANEMKLILAQFLLNYDLELPEGAEKGAGVIPAGAGVAPDPTKTLLMKKVPV